MKALRPAADGIARPITAVRAVAGRVALPKRPPADRHLQEKRRVGDIEGVLVVAMSPVAN